MFLLSFLNSFLFGVHTFNFGVCHMSHSTTLNRENTFSRQCFPCKTHGLSQFIAPPLYKIIGKSWSGGGRSLRKSEDDLLEDVQAVSITGILLLQSLLVIPRLPKQPERSEGQGCGFRPRCI